LTAACGERQTDEVSAMFAMFARFNYKSPNLEVEEKNYLEHHVRLARQLLGVRMYLTGKLLATAPTKPDRYRAVVFLFDSPESAALSYNCPAGAELAADSAGHIDGTVIDAFRTQMFIPLDSRLVGQRCFLMARAFDLKSGERASNEYAALQQMIRKTPGLRGYLAGQLQPAGDQKPDRAHMEVVVFDHHDAFRAAFAGGPATAEQSLLLSPRTYFLDGRVEL
jgi:hypothetical protein